jgi:hypothetical protein
MMRCARILCLIGAAAALTVAGGCASSTDAGVITNLDVRGTWHYTGTQGSPSATLDGTLTVTDYSAGNFSGKLDLQETNAQGIPHNRAGIVTGRTLSGATVDYDAFLSIVSRRHVGRVVADSIVGTWAEQGTAGLLTGTFRAVRASR